MSHRQFRIVRSNRPQSSIRKPRKAFDGSHSPQKRETKCLNQLRQIRFPIQHLHESGTVQSRPEKRDSSPKIGHPTYKNRYSYPTRGFGNCRTALGFLFINPRIY
jgi:hypothetical protein